MKILFSILLLFFIIQTPSANAKPKKKSEVKKEIKNDEAEEENNNEQDEEVQIIKKHSSKGPNIRISPLGLLIVYLNVDADFKMGKKMSIGPTVSYFSLSSSIYKTSIYYLGARMNYNLSGDIFESGWELSPFLRYVGATATVSYLGSSATATINGINAGSLIGYHWYWDGFNLSLGAGLQYTNLPKTTDVTVNGVKQEATLSSSSSTSLALDFMIGWLF